MGYNNHLPYDKIRLSIQEGNAKRKKPKYCEICGNSGKIVYDHDHKTGNFRGWICSNCNCALGFAKDNPIILKLLAEYLENI